VSFGFAQYGADAGHWVEAEQAWPAASSFTHTDMPSLFGLHMPEQQSGFALQATVGSEMQQVPLFEVPLA